MRKITKLLSCFFLLSLAVCCGKSKEPDKPKEADKPTVVSDEPTTVQEPKLNLLKTISVSDAFLTPGSIERWSEYTFSYSADNKISSYTLVDLREQSVDGQGFNPEPRKIQIERMKNEPFQPRYTKEGISLIIYYEEVTLPINAMGYLTEFSPPGVDGEGAFKIEYNDDARLSKAVGEMKGKNEETGEILTFTLFSSEYKYKDGSLIEKIEQMNMPNDESFGGNVTTTTKTTVYTLSEHKNINNLFLPAPHVDSDPFFNHFGNLKLVGKASEKLPAKAVTELPGGEKSTIDYSYSFDKDGNVIACKMDFDRIYELTNKRIKESITLKFDY